MSDEPRRIAQLPHDRHGRPVPWFVAWIDGAPDFRVIGSGKIEQSMAARLCWICGKPRGKEAWFVIGPMCAINRTSAEPPSHRDCAVYSATHCPFLTKPHMHRRENAMPEGSVEGAGVMLRRNPGVALVWHSAGYQVWKPGADHGVLFDVGEPMETVWYAEGRSRHRSCTTMTTTTGEDR